MKTSSITVHNVLQTQNNSHRLSTIKTNKTLLWIAYSSKKRYQKMRNESSPLPEYLKHV